MDARSVMAKTAAGRDFYLCLGDFLDEFYRADKSARCAMLKTPPDFESSNLEQPAYLASA